MDILNQDKETHYNGIYRAKVIKVYDESKFDVKNGLYKVRIYPFNCDTDELKDDDVPVAQSNLTNKYGHICIKENDWVWVMLENGNPRFPVIIGFCNGNGLYPTQAVGGDDPTYYTNIEADTDISENEVTYNGEYGTVDGFDFGENIHVEVDEENKQIIFITDKHQIILDKDGNLHLKFSNIFVKVDDKCNFNINGNKIKVTSSGILMEDSNGTNTVEITNNGITVIGASGGKLEVT